MCGLGAFVETVKVYRELDVVGAIWKAGKVLCDGIREITDGLGITDCFMMTGLPCSPGYLAKDKTGQISMEFRTLFMQEMVNSGVLMPWIALSYSHDAICMEATLEAARKALGVYARALEEGVGRYLEGEPVKPVFRKYN